MKPFLRTVAEDLYTTTNGNFEHVTIIFPNKRANLFFNQHLADLHGDKPLWLPQYMTISDMFASLSQYSLADKIMLVCMLYQSYKKIIQSEETLDKFYSWGEIMLQDFNDIDNSMIPADKLFANIEELADMTDFSFMSETQIRTVQTYFANFNPKNNTKLKEKFGTLWSRLFPIYEDFKSELRSAGFAYDGMLKREVIELLESLDGQHHNIPADQTFAIVGFNVLSKTEETLFSYLKKHYNTLFYWDFDYAYINMKEIPELASNFEAGLFMRRNVFKYGDRLTDNVSEHNNMRSHKQISIISASTENAQARYATEWLPQVIDSEQPLNNTAIILCNESMLQPLFHSIPQELTLDNGAKRTLQTNITMGHPLMQTSISSFVNLLLTLQIKGASRTQGTWNHAVVRRLLTHPLTARLTNGESARIATQLKNDAIVYPTTNDATGGNQILKQIFQPQSTNSDLLEYLSTIVETIGMTFNNADDADANDFITQLNIEAIYNIHKIVNRLTTLHQSSLLNINTRTLAGLLTQIMAAQSIPFHGEPATGIQIMGMLETRNLDFRNVLIMSANEGNIPPTPNVTSLIPYTLREAYGMTTIEKQTSLYAYYFYRLMQRAENISIMYNSSTEGLNSNGEMSRFATQVLIHSDNLFSADTGVKTYSIQSPSTPMTGRDIIADKSQQTLDKLNSVYNSIDNESVKTLTPSTINTFIDCPLKFYFNKLSPIPLATEESVDEDVDSALFGNIIHHVLERIYKDYVGKIVNEKQLTDIANDEERIDQYVNEEINEAFFQGYKDYQRLTGQQLLNRKVIVDYLKRQLQTDAKACPLHIIKLENGDHKLKFNVTDDTSVIIGGIIDRMDSTIIEGEERLRIVDYKTSASPHTASDISALFNNRSDKRPYHILQAMTYTLIVASTNTTPLPVSPSLFYVKQTQNTEPIDSVIKIGKKRILDFAPMGSPDDITTEFTDNLHTVFKRMFDPQQPFLQTQNTKICEYCDLKQICRK